MKNVQVNNNTTCDIAHWIITSTRWGFERIHAETLSSLLSFWPTLHTKFVRGIFWLLSKLMMLFDLGNIEHLYVLVYSCVNNTQLEWKFVKTGETKVSTLPISTSVDIRCIKTERCFLFFNIKTALDLSENNAVFLPNQLSEFIITNAITHSVMLLFAYRIELNISKWEKSFLFSNVLPQVL